MKASRAQSHSGARGLALACGIALLAAGAARTSGSVVEVIPLTSSQALAREAPRLVARMSSWQSEPIKTRKGPPGFGLEFQFVGLRFDGTFGIEGVPQTVPEGEAFVALVQLTNAGRKSIKVGGVRVTGDGISLTTLLLQKKVLPRTSAMVASFKVPPQSFAGSTFLINVVLGNGDKHRATLSFAKPS